LPRALGVEWLNLTRHTTYDKFVARDVSITPQLDG
jgi:hypothetical protein